MNLIFLMTFHSKGWVFGDLDNVFGIIDSDHVICDDHLLSERKYLVFLIV